MSATNAPFVNDAILAFDPDDPGGVRIRSTSCADCGETNVGSFTACAHCGSLDVSPTLLPTSGTVWSYTVAHHPPPGAWSSRLTIPCTLAVVTLGGARVYGPVLGAKSGVDIGTRVRVVPLELTSPEDETLTAFAFAEDLAA